MRKEVGLLFLSLIFISCTTQKKTVFDENKCKIVIVPPPYDLESFYKNIDSTYLFKNELTNINAAKNGIFYYKWHEGFPSGSFFIVNVDNDYSVSRKSFNFNKNTKLSQEDKGKLNELLKSLKEEAYYQSCSDDRGHQIFHLLIIKFNNQKVQYFSSSGFPSEVKMDDDNFKLTKEVFEIINKNFYKNY